MKFLRAFYHSFIWALEMKRRTYHDISVMGRINPDSIKDIDKFLRERGAIS